MKKNTVVVTRHAGLIEYLIEKGIVSKDVEIVAHATSKTVIGKHVVGVLPHSLSSLTLSYTEVPLHLPAELRGRELSLGEVKRYAQPAETYIVTKKYQF